MSRREESRKGNLSPEKIPRGQNKEFFFFIKKIA
jgi:hypothetical protein